VVESALDGVVLRQESARSALCQTGTVAAAASDNAGGMELTSGSAARPADAMKDDVSLGEFDFPDLRDDIRLSWRRSRQAMAPMDRMDVPRGDPTEDGERLLRAISPILARFAEQLDDTRIGLVLADRDGRVLRTWAGHANVRRHLASLFIDEGFVLSEGYAGTNGVGTVVEERRPIVVAGEEHYSEPLRHLVCAGTPLYNPITARLEGVLDLSCPCPDWSNLVVPSLAQLRRDIEQELSDRTSARQRLTFERFVARCRETSAAIVGISEQYMITNAAAADLITHADQSILLSALGNGDEGVQSITLSNGSVVQATSHPIRYGEAVTGRLIELRPETTSAGSGAKSRRIENLDRRLARVARARPDRLLLTGEPGSGRLTAARLVHERVTPDRPLVVHSCELSLVEGGRAWLDELVGLLRKAEGTLVLRHVDLLDGAVRQAVAALLEQHRGSMPIFATAGPGSGAAPGAWLWAQAGAAVLRVPSLRERRSELPALVAATLREIRVELHVTSRALAALRNYDWPGNLTQLRAVLHQAADEVGVSSLIGIEHLPAEISGALRGTRSLSRIEELEREAMILALRQNSGNKLRAAAALGMSRSTFYRRLRQLGLDTALLLA